MTIPHTHTHTPQTHNLSDIFSPVRIAPPCDGQWRVFWPKGANGDSPLSPVLRQSPYRDLAPGALSHWHGEKYACIFPLFWISDIPGCIPHGPPIPAKYAFTNISCIYCIFYIYWIPKTSFWCAFFIPLHSHDAPLAPIRRKFQRVSPIVLFHLDQTSDCGVICVDLVPAEWVALIIFLIPDIPEQSSSSSLHGISYSPGKMYLKTGKFQANMQLWLMLFDTSGQSKQLYRNDLPPKWHSFRTIQRRLRAILPPLLFHFFLDRTSY